MEVEGIQLAQAPQNLEQNSGTATTDAFYAAGYQPAGTTGPIYLWAPLVILAVGVLALVLVLAMLRRPSHDHLGPPPSMFDQ